MSASACLTATAAGVAIGYGISLLLKRRAPSLKSKGKLALYYFGIPALGEPIRMLLTLGGFDWEDKIVGGGPEADVTWPELKPTSKWGQIPILKLADGSQLAQTQALFRYLGKEVCVDGKPLYPADPFLAYQVDEFIGAFEDVRLKMVSTFGIADQAEKEATRAKLVAPGGAAALLLDKLEECAASDESLIAGYGLTLADVWAFFFLNFLRCGFWDGLSPDCIKRYTRLNRVAASVSRLPVVAAYYSAIDTEKKPLYKAYQPRKSCCV